MGAVTDIKLLNERNLTERARQGDRAAFDELAARHVSVAWGLAGAVTRHPGLAVDATAAGVAAAFAEQARESSTGTATASALVPLLRATRHAALDGPSDPTAELSAVTVSAPALDQRAVLVREAFHALPERWRSALWLAEVERLDTPVATAALELAPGELTTLVERATSGLGQQLLSGGMRAAAGSECDRTVERLPGYMVDDLSERDVLRVRKHLDGCERCRQRVAALDDLLSLLRQCTVPVPDPLVAEARRRWAAAVVPAAGPLGLVLPGGRTLPVWVERAVAGTAAAVVTLGITGALITSGGKGSRLPDAAPRTSVAAAPISGSGSGDGESALGAAPGLSEVDLEPGNSVPVPGGSSTGRAATPSGSSAPSSVHTSGGSSGSADDTARSITGTEGAASSGAVTPAGSTSTTTPTTTTSPSSTPPAAPSPTTNTPPPAPQPVPSDATLDLGLLSITLGDCSNLTVLGTPLGCTPTATSTPTSPTTDLGGALLDPLGLGG
jgi:DNA-directed RNA polymerase specialized sigma24 family protein